MFVILDLIFAGVIELIFETAEALAIRRSLGGQSYYWAILRKGGGCSWPKTTVNIVI